MAESLRPASGTGEIAWIRQSFANRSDATAKTLKQVNDAISDLNNSMSQASNAGLNSSDHFRSNYVMGGLYVQKAMLLANLAANRRAEAVIVRSRLADEYRWYMDPATQGRAIAARLKGPNGSEGATTEPAKTVAGYVQDIDGQIEASEQRIAQLQQAMVGPRQQVEQAKARSQQLQEQLGQLDQQGYDVTDAASFAAYKKAYTDLSAQLRKTDAKIQALQEGTMAGAKVDPAGSDDLTKATYVGGTEQVGLNTLATRLTAEQKILANLQAARKSMQESHASLVKYNEGMDESVQRSNARCQTVLAEMNKTCTRLDELMKAAADREDEALAACKQAERSYTTALQAAKKDQGDAANELSTANPTPDKPNRRLEMIRDYKSAEVGAQRGLIDVYMLVSRINLQRAADLLTGLGVLQMAQSCGARPADLGAAQQSLQEAINAATMALAAPDSRANALYHAEQLSRSIQREKYTWMGPAMRGLVYNMLAEVQEVAGMPQAAESRAKAAEALGEAVKGNENSELLQPYTLLLASIKTQRQD